MLLKFGIRILASLVASEATVFIGGRWWAALGVAGFISLGVKGRISCLGIMFVMTFFMGQGTEIGVFDIIFWILYNVRKIYIWKDVKVNRVKL